MKELIKNKRKFYRFLKENLKTYNKNICKTWLNDLLYDSTEKLEGLHSFEISKNYTKNNTTLLYWYDIEIKTDKTGEAVNQIIITL